MEFNLNSEIRVPEIRKKPEIRTPGSLRETDWAKFSEATARTKAFGPRASDFFRISDFELRVSGSNVQPFRAFASSLIGSQ